jgi:hypothetical protein
VDAEVLFSALGDGLLVTSDARKVDKDEAGLSVAY